METISGIWARVSAEPATTRGSRPPRLAIPLPSQIDGLGDGWTEAFAAVVDRFRAAGCHVASEDPFRTS